jgi:hypothetical protein
MTTNDPPPQELREAFIEALNMGLDTGELSEKFNRSPGRIGYWKRWAFNNGKVTVEIPKSTMLDVESQTPIINGDCFVAGDFEIPRHSVEAIKLLVEMQAYYKLPNLVLNGDVFVSDIFSTWPVEIARLVPSFAEEWEAGQGVLQALLLMFENVYLVTGGHEARLSKKLGGQLSYAELLNGLAPGLSCTQHHKVYVGNSWMIAHPKDYAKVPLAVSRDVAERVHRNVILGHTHHLGMCRDKSNKFWCIDGGCMTEWARAFYKAGEVSRHPEWVPGFVMLKNERPYLIDLNIDKNFWIGERK